MTAYAPVRTATLAVPSNRIAAAAGRALGDEAVLLDIAEEEGFERDAAAAALASEEWGRKVRAEQQAAWDLNITGVPAMIVENKFMIPGAQPPEAYADALRRVAEKTAA